MVEISAHSSRVAQRAPAAAPAPSAYAALDGRGQLSAGKVWASARQAVHHATSRPGASPRAARPLANRHDAGVRQHQAAAAQAGGGLLRGEGPRDVEHV